MLPRKKTNPNARACLQCRDKHLKCDAQSPICARCVAVGVACVYVQSRRGYRMPAPKTPTAMLSRDSVFESYTQLGQQQMPSGPDTRAENTPEVVSVSEETTSIPLLDQQDPVVDHLVGLYYQYIHPAHPFILPQKLYLQNRQVFPDCLRNAICFISSHHSSDRSDRYRDATAVILGTTVLDDGFKVQSLILFTLASYARFERDRGNQALIMAIDLARRIGLDSDAFGQGYDHIYQESWRRTWWELYTIAGLISLIGGTNLRPSQPANMMLPMSCEVYNACLTQPIGTNQAIRQRFSAESNFEWSSFAYRIEAMRLLTMVLDITNDMTQQRPDAAESAISSFLLSLPLSKREGLHRNGDVDEVMSCALMIIHLACICLHLPRSILARLRGFKTVCGNERGAAATERDSRHEAAALRSAKAIAQLISSRATLSTLSPCFSCAIAFAATVQLPAYMMHKTPESDYLKEHIQLELSALQSLGEIWPIAHVVRGQIAQFSREVFSQQQHMSVPLIGTLPTPVTSIPDEQWLYELISDDFAFPDASTAPTSL